jgi:hypothetical protein
MLIRLIAIIALLWAGMILGISFLESWVKFRAPSLTKAVGLDVGRTVFRFFHKAQCVLLILIIIEWAFIRVTFTNFLIIGMLISIFMLQITWLFPRLNLQVNSILAGNKIADRHTHKLYGIFEITKFLILVGISIKFIFVDNFYCA